MSAHAMRAQKRMSLRTYILSFEPFHPLQSSRSGQLVKLNAQNWESFPRLPGVKLNHQETAKMGSRSVGKGIAKQQPRAI